MNAVADAITTTRRIPGDTGAWVFMLGDMSVFTLFFATFIYYRGQAPELFDAARQMLSIHIGLGNTLLLLLSSWLVALGLKGRQHYPRGLVAALWLVAISCGLGFATLKIIEYRTLIAQGANLNSQDFFMFYFMMTGLHFLHLCIGLIILATMVIHVLRSAARQQSQVLLEVGSCYWHMVDLLWIILFPLLYLISI